jgi:hypothetical protein
MRDRTKLEPDRVIVRRVGTCAHCGGAVLLRVRVYRVLCSREARCACGATVIRPSFFAAARMMIKPDHEPGGTP